MTSTAFSRNPARTLAFAAAAFFIGQAISVSNGALSTEALRSLSIAVVSAAFAILTPRPSGSEHSANSILVAAIGVGLAVQLGDLLVDAPGVYLRVAALPHGMATYQRGIAIAAVAAGIAIAARGRMATIALLALVATHFVLGVWMIRNSPEPHIDVFYFQRDGSEALLHGVNPYAITFPNIYGDGSPFYGPGMSLGGRLQFGFPYPPFSLLLALPGHALGDYRYSQLIAMDIAGLAMGFMTRNRLGVLAALIYLFTPRNFFVLEQGWTEPFAVLLVAAVTWCGVHRTRALPYVVGMLFAVKQYMIFAFAPTLLLFDRWTDWRALLRFWGKAVGVAAMLTLPLALWSWHAFFHSVIALQFFQPFRADALSYLGQVARSGDPSPPSSIAFGAALIATLLSLFRLPRSPEGFAGATAIVFLAFFALNKQAFANYYFFVIGTFCCAVAAAPVSPAWSEKGRGESPRSA